MTPAAGILLLVLLSCPRDPEGAAYYVDAERGDDANAGTGPATAWKTLARVNAAQPRLKPGDRVLFRRGRVFPGGLVLQASGEPGRPIAYGGYGEGARPELTGLAAPGGWTPSGPVWKARLPAGRASVQLVVVDGRPRPLGRFPNADAPGGGYLTVDSHVGRTSITDADLPTTADWTGADVVIRKVRWVIDRSRVTRHEGRTLTYAATSSYDAVDGHGYFLQDHPATLDAFGEWCVDPAADELRVHLGGSDPARAAVTVSVVDVLVQASGRRHVVLEGLAFSGADRAALRIDDTEGIVVRDCAIRASGVNAVQGARVKGLLLEDCSIEDTQNNGIHLDEGPSGVVLRRVRVARTGLHPGMGGSGDGTYNAIVVLGGSDHRIEDFTITETGYLPVHFGGSRVTVRNGFIRDFASVKDDAGGIYTWTGAKDRTPYADRVVEGNIILDGKGAPAGASGETKAYGIYLDDCASGVEVRNNVVARTDGGLFLHNAHHCRVSGNTLFDNAVQLLMIHDDIGPEGAIRAIEFVENILVSRTRGQPVLTATSVEDDFARFGTFERNVYARPADPGLIVRHGVRDGRPRAYDLEGRRAATGLDRTTRPSSVRIAPYRVGTTGPELVDGGDFEAGLGNASCWSGPGNGEIVLDEGKLDGRSLHHRYKAPSGAPQTSLLTVRAGPLTAGKRYVLRFSILGSADRGSAGVHLRDGDSPWAFLTPDQDVQVDRMRREVERVFTAPMSKAASSVEWAFNEPDGTFWLDNVSFREADVIEPEAGLFRLELNPSDEPRSVRLAEAWVDVDGRTFTGELVLPPRGSRVLIRKDACLPPK